MSGPKPPATSTLPSRRRVATKPTRLVCMLGALPQLSPHGEARNTWVSLTACGPSEPVAISTRPSASSITICASPREGGPAGVSMPDHRPRAAGEERGVTVGVRATGDSLPAGVALAVGLCIAAAAGLEAAGEHPPRTRLPASSSHIASNSRSEEHTSELQSRFDLVCRLLLEKKK